MSFYYYTFLQRTVGRRLDKGSLEKERSLTSTCLLHGTGTGSNMEMAIGDDCVSIVLGE